MGVGDAFFSYGLLPFSLEPGIVMGCCANLWVYSWTFTRNYTRTFSCIPPRLSKRGERIMDSGEDPDANDMKNEELEPKLLFGVLVRPFDVDIPLASGEAD